MTLKAAQLIDGYHEPRNPVENFESVYVRPTHRLDLRSETSDKMKQALERVAPWRRFSDEPTATRCHLLGGSDYKPDHISETIY